MKQIPEVKLEGAVVLTPLEMNAIHFDAGIKSQYVADTLSQTKADPVPKPGASASETVIR